MASGGKTLFFPRFFGWQTVRLPSSKILLALVYAVVTVFMLKLQTYDCFTDIFIVYVRVNLAEVYFSFIRQTKNSHNFTVNVDKQRNSLFVRFLYPEPLNSGIHCSWILSLFHPISSPLNPKFIDSHYHSLYIPGAKAFSPWPL